MTLSIVSRDCMKLYTGMHYDKEAHFIRGKEQV